MRYAFAMTPIPRDWFDYTNLAVGAVGLFLTLWAVRSAKGAKSAAERAENSVQRHNAEADFGSLARMARELHSYVENGNFPEARLRTTDLRSELAGAVGRHRRFLSGKLSAIEGKQIALKLVSDKLSPSALALSALEKNRLLSMTGAILEELSTQWGDLRSRVEKGG
jgi:hypothetical protein